MTRRDFEFIAAVIAAQNSAPHGFVKAGWRHGTTESRTEGLRWLANDFATRLQGVNPRFDRTRFMRACGFGEG